MVKRTNQEWKELFAHYEDANEVTYGIDRTVVKLLLKTPKKGRTEPDTDLTPVFVPNTLKDIAMQADILPSEYFWWTMDDDTSLLPGLLLQFLRDLRDFALVYEQWLIKPHEVTSSRLALVEDDLHQLKSFCDTISGNVGRPVSIQDMDFPDLWCAIEYIGSSLPSITSLADMSTLKQSILQLEQFANQSRQSIDNLQQNANVMVGLRASLEKVELTLTKHESRFMVIQPILLHVNKLVNDVNDLRHKLEALDIGTSPAPVGNDPWSQNAPFLHTFSLNAPLPDKPSSPSNTGSPRGDMEARIKTLEHALQSLEKRRSPHVDGHTHSKSSFRHVPGCCLNF
jgi:hypothetical protein